jgi:membrane-associated protease RseP (regulator of RpoE activity)
MPDFNSFSDFHFENRQAMRPTLRTWIKHTILLLIAFVTCTIAGVLQPFGFEPFLPGIDPQTWTEFLQILPNLPFLYAQNIFELCGKILTDFRYLQYGLSFSISVLFILICHEMGHYIACRIYKVDATLPYFIPTPPMIGPAGTLGAFIKIVSPMPSRRAVFDIGVAGPIAGFVALLPIAFLAVLTTQPANVVPAQPNELELIFSDPLLYQFFAYLGGINLSQPFYSNPFYFATWLGLLVTALNLIPSGQLDGGHAIYAVFGGKIHKWTGRIAFVTMTFFSILGLYLYSSPSGLLFAVILAVMLRVGHPEPIDETPLDNKRKVIAFLTLIIFILCFVPFPIQIK